jgi:UPF0755 protein
MRRALVVFLVTSALGLSAVALIARAAWRYGDTARGTARGRVEIEIPKGATARDVAGRLAAAGLIGDATIFRLYAGQRGVAGRFKAGRYDIDAPASPKQILETLVKGAADELVAVTVPEGKNLLEIADILAAAGIADRDEIIRKATDPLFAASLGIGAVSAADRVGEVGLRPTEPVAGGYGNPQRVPVTLEGYLFPDTYRLRPRTPAARALIPLVRRHRQVFDEIKAAHARGVAELRRTLGFDDHKIVVLASIVEKETGQAQERPRIAQVFINRLRLPTFAPKLLQTDPTIIYGCTVAAPRSAACLKWDGRIRRIQLEDRDNPYNTYAHEGLPPGPIANPGRAALEAVMASDGTPFLYFVSRNDGTHFFSKTVAEHNAAVVKYQRGGKPLAP